MNVEHGLRLREAICRRGRRATTLACAVESQAAGRKTRRGISTRHRIRLRTRTGNDKASASEAAERQLAIETRRQADVHVVARRCVLVRHAKQRCVPRHPPTPAVLNDCAHLLPTTRETPSARSQPRREKRPPPREEMGRGGKPPIVSKLSRASLRSSFCSAPCKPPSLYRVVLLCCPYSPRPVPIRYARSPPRRPRLLPHERREERPPRWE